MTCSLKYCFGLPIQVKTPNTTNYIENGRVRYKVVKMTKVNTICYAADESCKYQYYPFCVNGLHL